METSKLLTLNNETNKKIKKTNASDLKEQFNLRNWFMNFEFEFISPYFTKVINYLITMNLEGNLTKKLTPI